MCVIVHLTAQGKMESLNVTTLIGILTLSHGLYLRFV